MSVNSYLQTLGSDLVLSTYEHDKIKTSVDTIKTRLSYYFGSTVTEKKVFGSYDRGTILPRRADSRSDVDLMVVFENPYGYKPQTFLNKLKSFAEYYYSRSEIYQSSPTIVLELNHIMFELVPAYVQYGCYYIPNGPSNWVYTDTDGLKKAVTDSNVNNSYKVKPIIRLLKHWNIQKNSRDLPSYMLEKLVADDLKYAYISCSTYSEYVRKALNAIKYLTDYFAVDKAISIVDEAISLESQNMPYSALAKIKEAFPEI